MTSPTEKLGAMTAVTVLTLSVMVPAMAVSMVGVAAGNTLSSGPVSTSGSGQVDLSRAVVSAAGNSQVTVAYDASNSGLSTSNLRISLSDGKNSLDSATGNALPGTSGTVTLTIPDSAATSDFTGFVTMSDTSSRTPSVIASDSADILVRDVSNPPAVDITATGVRPYTSQRLVAGYDSAGVSGSNLELRLYNVSATPDTKLDTTSLSGGSTGSGSVTYSAGGADATARVELWNTQTNTKLASDTASVTVGNPSVSMSSKTIDPTTSTTVNVNYDAGPSTASKFRIMVMEFSGGSSSTLGQQTVSAASGTASVDITNNIPNDMSERKNVMAVLMTKRGHFLASGGACLGVSGDPCPSVTSTSIEYADGTSASNVAVDASVGQFGMLDVTVHEAGTPSKTNLSRVSGFDTSKDVWVNVTTKHVDTGALMGAADVTEWFTTSVDSTTNVTHIRLQPAQLFRNETVQTRNPSRWPTSTGTATTKRTAVELSLFDFNSAPPSANIGALRGATLATDAQAFQPPQLIQQNGQTVLRLPVAGPHFETDGQTQNTGFYHAFVPDGMLTKMGLSNPAGLVANYQGSEISRTITKVDGGVQIRANIHYSSGNVDLSPDTTAPTADAGSSKTVTAGDSVTLDASSSSDNTEIATYEWDVDDDGTYEKSTSSKTTGYTYSSSGDRTVTLRVTDANDNTDTDTVSVSVEADSSGGGSSGGGGGGSSSSTSSSTTSGVDSNVQVTTSDGTAEITVGFPSVNTATEIDVPAVSGGSDAVALDTMSIRTTTDRRFTLETSTSDGPPTDSPALDTDATGSEPALGYIEVDHSVPDRNVDSASFDFTVRTKRIEKRGLDPEDVVLYRYHDGSWNDLETTVTGSSDSAYRFGAMTPGLSTFAVGTETTTPTVTVADATLSTTTATVGDTVEIAATVENTGGSTGSTTLSLIVDGDRVTQRSVTVPAGETRTVSFDHSFSSAGDHTVHVANASVGAVSVASAASVTPDAVTTTDAPTTIEPSTTTIGGSATTAGGATTDASGPGFTAGFALLALFVGSLLVVRRRFR